MQHPSALLLFLLWTLGGTPAGGQEIPKAACAPEKVIKLVTTADQPGQDPQAFASQPKTLWRQGERLARLEERLNSETGAHLLVVIAEPDLWIVDRAKGLGRHLLDPGPLLVVRLPVFHELTTGIWPELELGCEASFFRRHGAAALHSEDGMVYLLRDGDLRVRLKVDVHDRPVRIEAERGDFKRGLDYLSYETLAELDPKLFEQPQGILWEEPPASSPEPAQPRKPR